MSEPRPSLPPTPSFNGRVKRCVAQLWLSARRGANGVSRQTMSPAARLRTTGHANYRPVVVLRRS